MTSELGFPVQLKIWLSTAQDEWLEAEVARRRVRGVISDMATARGSNQNMNKGVLIREALEKQFGITK